MAPFSRLELELLRSTTALTAAMSTLGRSSLPMEERAVVREVLRGQVKRNREATREYRALRRGGLRADPADINDSTLLHEREREPALTISMRAAHVPHHSTEKVRK